MAPTVFMQVLLSETSEGEKHEGSAALCSSNTILFIHSAVLDFDEVSKPLKCKFFH